MSTITIRAIEPRDNAAIAKIIRDALLEHGAARPGTVYFDESTDRLSEVFQTPKSAYWVAEQDGILLGGAGIYPTDGLGEHTCELVKMYLKPEARGSGLGKALMDKCIEQAIKNGYDQLYLETLPGLPQAIKLYERTGFEKLSAPLGQSGHYGCGMWMLKQLKA